MRYIFIFVLLVLLVGGCSNSTDIVKNEGIKSKNITIQIEDNQNTQQYYSIQITTNGKETKKLAVVPQDMVLITDNKRQVKTEVFEDVPYTIKVYKTNAKLVKEMFNKPKIAESSSQIEEPLADINFTPSNDLNNLKIRVNPTP